MHWCFGKKVFFRLLSAILCCMVFAVLPLRGFIALDQYALAMAADPRLTWPEKLTLALVPYQVPPHLYDSWTPLADYLSDKLGIPVKLTTANIYEHYVAEVLTNRPELAHFNALQYIIAHRKGGYEALIGGTHQQIGIFIVRVDSSIQTITDLRGKTIAFLPPSAMPGHLQPKAFFTRSWAGT